MLLESIIAKNLLQKETEKFSEDKKDFGGVMWLGVLYLVAIFIYVIALLILWIRVVVKAFSCSTRDGMLSVLTPSLYAMYVFADTITLTCAKSF